MSIEPWDRKAGPRKDEFEKLGWVKIEKGFYRQKGRYPNREVIRKARYRWRWE